MRSIATGWMRVVRVVLGLDPPTQASERRYAGIARGALSALGARGLGMVVGLVAVPLAVGYLGAERYGAWMTILSFLAWLSIADLGLGNELLNALSRAHGRGDEGEARSAVSAAFWMLVAVALALAAVGGVIWWHLDWPKLLNVHSRLAMAEVAPAMGLAFALFCLSFPLAVVDRVYLSFQEGATANAWGVMASLASFAAIVVTVRTEGGLVWLVAATAGAGLLVKAVNAIWLFWRSKPTLRPTLAAVSGASAAQLAKRGAEFFFVQIAALVLFSSDNIVIARVLGAEHVTPYSVTWRLLGLTNVLIAAAFPYLWAAYGDAIARRDGAWAARTLRRSVIGSVGVTLVLLVPLTLFGQPIIRAWAGSEAVPSGPLLWWMAGWFLMQAPTNAIAAFLNAAGKVRFQIWIGLPMAAVNIGLSVYLARIYGSAGVIAATVISYGLISLVPISVVTVRTARALRRDGPAHQGVA